MFLQKPAQQNILQYEGQIFKEMILYFAAIPAHTLTCSLSFSKLQSEDEVWQDCAQQLGKCTVWE